MTLSPSIIVRPRFMFLLGFTVGITVGFLLAFARDMIEA
jgi:hypothetical protein